MRARHSGERRKQCSLDFKDWPSYIRKHVSRLCALRKDMDNAWNTYSDTQLRFQHSVIESTCVSVHAPRIEKDRRSFCKVTPMSFCII